MNPISIYFFLVVNPLVVLTDKQYGIERKESRRKALFRKISTNRILNIVPIYSYNNCDLKCCARNCLKASNCESFNFNVASSTCDLLYVD